MSVTTQSSSGTGSSPQRPPAPEAARSGRAPDGENAADARPESGPPGNPPLPGPHPHPPTAPEGSVTSASRASLAPRLEQLLGRARLEGAVRTDLTVADLIMIMITEFAHRSSPVRPDAYRRYLKLIISSLRPQPAVDDLGVALSAAEVQAIARQWAEPSH
ncbi:hypothetical protein [Streptomyces sp. NPDC088727]|uniref:SbtR family transcriptional regulator n=1 Tax=Streptomyces sp. NPDC088727 TaxID=3365875 RepID=UPI003822AAD8